eukprot:TRINITY_DN20540_c0_g1_i1.p1 TRINITY_DN20540_c0_g1~~TRINITY_DN20540_c0_g1_i1.p1  ORF type:complete len:200 (+),score=44.11 TRINITY_DN20540_c0_g1_i1:1-600(+)
MCLESNMFCLKQPRDSSISLSDAEYYQYAGGCDFSALKYLRRWRSKNLEMNFSVAIVCSQWGNCASTRTCRAKSRSRPTPTVPVSVRGSADPDLSSTTSHPPSSLLSSPPNLQWLTPLIDFSLQPSNPRSQGQGQPSLVKDGMGTKVGMQIGKKRAEVGRLNGFKEKSLQMDKMKLDLERVKEKRLTFLQSVLVTDVQC